MLADPSSKMRSPLARGLLVASTLALGLIGAASVVPAAAVGSSPPVVPGTAYSVGPVGSPNVTVTGRVGVRACDTPCVSGWRAGQILGHKPLGPTSNTVQWNNVMAPAAGTYKVTLYYWGGDPNGDGNCGGIPNPPAPTSLGCRPAEFSINGTPLPLSAYPTAGISTGNPGFQIPDSEATWALAIEGAYAIHLPLKAGVNTVRIYSTGADVDDLDQIIVDTGSGGPTPTPTVSPCQPGPSTALGSPTGLVATGGAGAQLTENWVAPDNPGSCNPPVRGYAVYTYGSDGSTSLTEVTTTSQTLSLTASTYYTFTVTDWNGVGWSGWAPWSAWTLLSPTGP